MLDREKDNSLTILFSIEWHIQNIGLGLGLMIDQTSLSEYIGL
jgi:hypothetical protein